MFPKRSLILTTAVGVTALWIAACGGGATPAPATTVPKTDTKSSAAGTGSGSPSASPQTQTKTAAQPTGSGKATGEPIRVGILCDRSGSQASVQPFLCDGAADWLDLFNNQLGGAKGRPVEPLEVDVKYEVPLAVDAYKKMTTREGVKMLIPVGTPLVDALAPASRDDKVVLWSPGFGLSDAADGKTYPYIFVGVATYHSQAMAALQYVADEWKATGKTGRPKVTYMYWDNPAGRDPLELIKREAGPMGLDLIDTVAVPGTTVDMTTIMAQVKDKNPDFIVAHVFAKMPILMLQGAEKVGYPANQIVALVWGLEEDTVRVSGSSAEGYRGLQFAAHPNDNPAAYKMLEGYWQSAGKTPNPRARQSLYYARGMLMGNFLAESARLADNPNDGDSLKKAIEGMKDFTAYELLAGTTLSPEDHGGTRKLRMYQVKEGKLIQIKDWFEGPLPKH